MQPQFLALLAAALFGASAPSSKLLLVDLTPLQLAGLLYLGAALGTAPPAWRDRQRVRANGAKTVIGMRNLRRLIGAVVFGGIVGPVLVLVALQLASSASVALLLNLEMAATAVLGVLFFREHLGRAGVAGVAAGLAAGVVLSFGGGAPGWLAGLCVLAACLAWGLDNHLTATIDGLSPATATVCKGLVAGGTSLALGLVLAPFTASAGEVALALLLGSLAFGASIVLYVVAAQHLGATRAQVAFSSAPIFGAGLAYLAVGEQLDWRHAAAAPLLVFAVVLLFVDRHEHEYEHAAQTHVHSHRHDDGHHDHEQPGLPRSTRHTHEHSHAAVVHTHRHLSDIHHRHAHESA
jgi:drug/metabolite transporter (DMT)-like permease